MADVATLLAILDRFDWEAWQASLDADLRPIARDLVVATGGRVLSEFAFDDPFVQEWFTSYVGERIVQLEGTTRTEVADLIRRVMATEGAASPMELATKVRDAVREQFDGYETWRALRIARSEVGIVGNTATALGAKQAGFTQMDITDGDKDEPCASANGAVWTIEELIANPLGHPNCTRAASPHVD